MRVNLCTVPEKGPRTSSGYTHALVTSTGGFVRDPNLLPSCSYIWGVTLPEESRYPSLDIKPVIRRTGTRLQCSITPGSYIGNVFLTPFKTFQSPW